MIRPGGVVELSHLKGRGGGKSRLQENRLKNDLKVSIKSNQNERLTHINYFHSPDGVVWQGHYAVQRHHNSTFEA